MSKEYITDDEFEKLNFHEQMKYKWCPLCEHYYLVSKGVCHGDAHNVKCYRRCKHGT